MRSLAALFATLLAMSAMPALANLVYQRTTESATAPLSSEPHGFASSATDARFTAYADDPGNIDAEYLRTLVRRGSPASDSEDGVAQVIELALIATVILAIVFLTTGTFLMLADPTCQRCGHRDWSKGVPHWRCRRCGRNHRPADPLVRVYVMVFLFRALYSPQRNPEWRHWVATARQAALPLMARTIHALQRRRKWLQVHLPLP